MRLFTYMLCRPLHLHVYVFLPEINIFIFVRCWVCCVRCVWATTWLSDPTRIWSVRTSCRAGTCCYRPRWLTLSTGEIVVHWHAESETVLSDVVLWETVMSMRKLPLGLTDIISPMRIDRTSSKIFDRISSWVQHNVMLLLVNERWSEWVMISWTVIDLGNIWESYMPVW